MYLLLPKSADCTTLAAASYDVVACVSGVFYTIHFCAFGEHWRKATSLAVWNFVELAVIDTYRCKMVNGCCGFSGKKHFNLTGLDPETGRW